MTSQPTSTAPGRPAAGLPHWMPGGSLDAQQEPVFGQLVEELGLLAPARS